MFVRGKAPFVKSFVIHFSAIALTLTVIAPAGPGRVVAQTGAARGEWRYYGGDAGSAGYSALDQINRQNVKALQVVWRWKVENFGAAPEYNLGRRR